MPKSTAKKQAKRKPRPKSSPVTPQRIMEMVWGFAPPLIAETALQLGVFDAMDAGAKTPAQIYEKTKTSPRGIAILLDGLVGIGLIHRRGETFTLAPDTAAFLVHSKPAFIGGLMKHVSRQLIASWMGLAESVRTGRAHRPVNQEDVGGEFFAQFVEDIFNMSFAAASAAAESLLKSATGDVSVLDIAAGSGVWGIAMAKRHPGVRVTAVDWHNVIPVTRRVATRHNLDHRFNYIEGDILQADLGKGHHIATLGHILHSEGESRSRRLLQRVRLAMAPGGTIVIGEFTPDEGRRGPALPLIFAVNMLVNTDEGSTFTFKQVASWLKEAGFRRPRLLHAPGPSPLILATA
ncbi:MAG: methyltransferase [Tepidisphaeraceae bacterium]|jgi:2-polyprenyl-3-methyl-5-hydroxy-6-metoxy-1,4-benzoquinol methylase